MRGTNLRLVARQETLAKDEPIDMRQLRFGYLPHVFLWHGHSYRVHAVERCWTIAPAWRGDGRLCFSVRCAEGSFELYQDLAVNTWHLRRARWNTDNSLHRHRVAV